MNLSAAIPPQVEDFDVQEQRCLQQLNSKESELEKFTYLSMLRANQVHLFYRIVLNHFTQLTPLIYTPVVGAACLQWSEIYQQPEGMYLSYDHHKGRLSEVLNNWRQEKVAMTVITDGSRILGLGDIGVNGMGIPIGKLSLYVACAGIDPQQVLPITIDLGTDNKELRENKFYLGSRRAKNSREEEEAFLDELMQALKSRWPEIVIQFEDWKHPFYTLEKYAPKYTMFNDDIQGTGAVIMGGIMSAIKNSGLLPRQHRAVFFGAGSAAVGVAKQIVQYFIHEGLSSSEARSCFWLVDRKGLVTSDRGDELPEHKVYFARHDNNGKQCPSLEDTLDFVKPTILIGLSGVYGAFSRQILQKMGKWNKLPIIFPLSNPLTKSECTFSEAITATEGRVLFASGSPFSHLPFKGGDYHPAQGNNMSVMHLVVVPLLICESKQVRVSRHRSRYHPLQSEPRHGQHDICLRCGAAGNVNVRRSRYRFAVSGCGPDPPCQRTCG
jgi:malate dehydrogenase (oxaloacetate-decarboxylating)(NADP+)